MEITVTRDITHLSGEKAKVEANFDYDLGATLRKAIDLHGEAAVYKCFIAGAIADLQAEAGRLLQGGRKGKNRVPVEDLPIRMQGYKLCTDHRKAELEARIAELQAKAQAL